MKKLILLTTLLIFTACSKPESNKTKLFLDWTPNTNHTGIFVAEELGFYKDEGLDLEVLLPGKSTAEMAVASGQADYAISFQSRLIQARSEGLPLISIAAIIQHSTSGYASPIGKNIASPKDFQGKTYGAYGSELEKPKLDLIMKKDGVAKPDTKIVQLGNSDFFTASESVVDFVNIFYGWTGIEAEVKGFKINYINTIDYAPELDTYEPIIVANSNNIKSDPIKTKKFIRATKKGYEYAIKNPKESAEIVLRKYPELNRELVIRSQEWLADKYIDDATSWGVQDKQRWDIYIDFMFENKILTKKLDSKDLFTNSFLE